jgi:hypothetical protein
MMIAAEREMASSPSLMSPQGFNASKSVPDIRLTLLTQVSRCVSLVEVFTFDRVMQMIDEDVSRINNPILNALYRDKKRSLDGSWESIRQAALDWLGVEFRTIKEYPRIEGYIEIRNSTLHASGNISRRQRNNIIDVTQKLKRVGVPLEGERLTPKKDCVRRAAIECRDFVAGLDQATFTLQRWQIQLGG